MEVKLIKIIIINRIEQNRISKISMMIKIILEIQS